jgi:GNAT superfamily N-acetyltransferase
MSGPQTELDWLTLQIHSLYQHDSVGRIVNYAGPPGDQGKAPFVFFGRTVLGNLWRVRAGLPDALTRDLFRFAAAEAVVPDLERKPERWAAMRSRIEEFETINIEFAGPAFRFPNVIEGGDEATLMRPGDEERIAASMPGFDGPIEDRDPMFAMIREERPVALAFCATVPGVACEVGVETSPGWRGHGFAGELVAAWAREMRSRGVEPLYSTSWENAASRAVARKLDLILYASDLHLR